MMEKEIAFLNTEIARYYDKNRVSGPAQINSREFGYGGFGRKIAIRHVSFATADLFNQFLKRVAPFYVSYSTARYELPEAKPMEAKLPKGSELIFEFDADDLSQVGAGSCYLDHTISKCGQCGNLVAGLPKLCDKCGGAMSVAEEFVCHQCLGEVKKQTLKLIDWLAGLGISEPMSINFSGSKGYHVHYHHDSIQKLTPSARAEIVDFLMPPHMDWKRMGFDLDHRSLPSTSAGFSWRKKFLQELPGVIPELSSLNKNQKEQALKGLAEGKMFGFTQAGKTDWNNWETALNEAKEKILPNFTIDRQVSIDASRLIRVPDTIHGGTILLAKSVSLQNLPSFNPLAEAIVLTSDPITVMVNSSPKFELGKETWGPFQQEKIKLPKVVAAYLMAKGLAALE